MGELLPLLMIFNDQIWLFSTGNRGASKQEFFLLGGLEDTNRGSLPIGT